MLVVALSSAPLVDCGGDAKIDDVAGTYVCRYDCGTELLRLKENGEYLQVVVLDGDTTTISHTGTWVFVERDNSVDLQGGLLLVDGFGTLRPDYMVPVSGVLGAGWYRRWLGTAYLVFNEDVGLAYQKIE